MENKQTEAAAAVLAARPLVVGWFMRAITCKLSSDISTLYTTGRASIMSPTTDYWTSLNILLTIYTIEKTYYWQSYSLAVKGAVMGFLSVQSTWPMQKILDCFRNECVFFSTMKFAFYFQQFRLNPLSIDQLWQAELVPYQHSELLCSEHQFKV